MEYLNIDLFKQLIEKTDRFRESSCMPNELKEKLDHYYQQSNEEITNMMLRVAGESENIQKVFYEISLVLAYMRLFLDIPELKGYVTVDKATAKLMYDYLYYLKWLNILQNNAIFNGGKAARV